MANLTTVPTIDIDPVAFIGDDTTDADTESLIEDELLVEEVSIDGMCGVY